MSGLKVDDFKDGMFKAPITTECRLKTACKLLASRLIINCQSELFVMGTDKDNNVVFGTDTAPYFLVTDDLDLSGLELADTLTLEEYVPYPEFHEMYWEALVPTLSDKGDFKVVADVHGRIEVDLDVLRRLVGPIFVSPAE